MILPYLNDQTISAKIRDQSQNAACAVKSARSDATIVTLGNLAETAWHWSHLFPLRSWPIPPPKGTAFTMFDHKIFALAVTIAFSVVGVLGDYFLKLASQEKFTFQSRWFYVGFALYASTAFGWVFVMKHLKLATISVLYSISMVVLLTAIGVTVFRESLSYYEMAGLAMAIGSLLLLMRFA